MLAEFLRVPTDLLWLADEEENPTDLRGRRAAEPASRTATRLRLPEAERLEFIVRSPGRLRGPR